MALTLPKSAFLIGGAGVTAATFTVPTGMTVGQEMVATVQVFNPSDAATLTANTAAGWSQLTANSTSFHQITPSGTSDDWQVATFVKQYTGTPSAGNPETVCTWTGSASVQTMMGDVAGQPSSPIDTSNAYGSTTSGTSFTVTTGPTLAQANEMVIAFWFNDQGFTHNSTPPSGWSLVINQPGFALLTQVFTSAGPIGSTIFTTSSGSCDHTVSMVAILATSTVSAHLTSSDTTSSSDSVARILGHPRSLSDTNATSDSAHGVNKAPRALSDTSTSSDSVQRLFRNVRPVADTSATGDNVFDLHPLTRSVSDTSSTSDAIINLLIQRVRAVADTTTSLDSVARSSPQVRSTSDASTSLDSAHKVSQSFIRAVSDTSASSDSLTHLFRYFRVTTDLSVMSDSSLGFHSIARTGSDASLLSDSLSRGFLALVRSITDTSVSTDSLSRVHPFLRSLSDTSVTTDAGVITHRVRFVTGADASSSSDTAQASAVNSKTGFDTSTSVDHVVWDGHVSRFLTETSLSTDSVIRILSHPRTSGDTTVTSDSLLQTFHYFRNASDATLLSDHAIGIHIAVRSSSDLSQSFDSVTKSRGVTLHDTSLTSDTSRIPLRLIVSSLDISLTRDYIFIRFQPSGKVYQSYGLGRRSIVNSRRGF